MDGITTLILMGAGMFLLFSVIIIGTQNYNLDGIRDRTVGNGQHGTARWATKVEVRKNYQHIPFTPTQWRKAAQAGQRGTQLPQGIILGCTGGKNTTAIVDTDDVHVLMIGASARLIIAGVSVCCGILILSVLMHLAASEKILAAFPIT